MDIQKLSGLNTVRKTTIVSAEVVTLNNGVVKVKCTTASGIEFWLFPSEILRSLGNLVGTKLLASHLTLLSGAELTWTKSQVCVPGQSYTRFTFKKNEEPETFEVEGDEAFLDSFGHAVTVAMSRAEEINALSAKMQLIALLPQVLIFDSEVETVTQTSSPKEIAEPVDALPGETQVPVDEAIVHTEE